jgi:hypothetical protein
MPEALALLLARCGLAATPMALGLLELERDRQFHRIAPPDRQRLVRVALDAGVEAAGVLRTSAGRESPREIADRLGVHVETIEDKSGGYDTVSVFADYQLRPPRIRLYARAIARLDRHLEDYPDGDRLAVTGTRPVFVAHELFHHLEGLDRKRALARRERVATLKLGPFRLTTGLSSLAEIAAGAFAQSLLGLRHHPKLLDVVATFDTDRAAAERLVGRLTTSV